MWCASWWWRTSHQVRAMALPGLYDGKGLSGLRKFFQSPACSKGSVSIASDLSQAIEIDPFDIHGESVPPIGLENRIAGCACRSRIRMRPAPAAPIQEMSVDIDFRLVRGKRSTRRPLSRRIRRHRRRHRRSRRNPMYQRHGRPRNRNRSADRPNGSLSGALLSQLPATSRTR